MVAMTPRPAPEDSDEKRPRRAPRKSGPSPVGIALVFAVLLVAVVLFISMNKKQPKAETQAAPAANPFEGLTPEAPPPPPSERNKKKG